MSNSLVTTDRWNRILIQKRNSFSLLGLSALSLVTNQESFHRHFEAECWRLNEPRAQTLLGRLDCSFYHIDSFLQVISKATLNQGTSGYVDLIWGACFGVIECVSRSGAPQRPIDPRLNGQNGPVQLIADLNNSIPNFESDLPYADEPSVQRALQDIFETYIDCCLSIITLFTRRPYPISQVNRSEAHSPRECVTLAAVDIGRAKGEFTLSVSLLSAMLPPVIAVPRRRDSSLKRSMPGEWPLNIQQQSTYPGEFRFDRFLGEGASGLVAKVTRISDGKSFARKRMQPQHVTWSKFRSRVLEEIKIMQRLKSVHIVTVEFHLEEPGHLIEIFMTPVADCDLDKTLRDCVQFGYPDEAIRQLYSWFGCLLKALAYIHSRSVVHKDIKPRNILVNNGRIYLADFGLSRDFMGGLSQSASSFSGTAEYQAPEVGNRGSYGRASDVFSEGCVFSEMLTVVAKKDLDVFKERRSSPVSHGFVDYSGTLRRTRRSFHISLDNVTGWVRSLGGDTTKDLLVRVILTMLEYAPADRGTAEEALEMLGGFSELSCKCHG